MNESSKPFSTPIFPGQGGHIQDADDIIAVLLFFSTFFMSSQKVRSLHDGS